MANFISEMSGGLKFEEEKNICNFEKSNSVFFNILFL